MYGINSSNTNWDYGDSTNTFANFIDVSLEGNYIVAGGVIDWLSAKFLAEGDTLRENCYPKQSCPGNSDHGGTTYSWERGFFHVYRD